MPNHKKTGRRGAKPRKRGESNAYAKAFRGRKHYGSGDRGNAHVKSYYESLGDLGRRYLGNEAERKEIRDEPVSVSLGATIHPNRRAYHMVRGAPQRLTEQGNVRGDGCRVEFEDQYDYLVGTDATPTARPFYTTLNTNLSSTSFSPSTLSTRFQNLCSGYQYYAVRDVEVTIVPTAGSGTNGTLAWGIASNTAGLPAVGSSVASATILEYRPSSMEPVWQETSLRYKFDGTQLWNTTTLSGASAGQPGYVQFALVGSWAAIPTSASATYGIIWMKGIIDLYHETPTVQNPSTFMSLEERSLAMSYLKKSDMARYAQLMLKDARAARDEAVSKENEVLISLESKDTVVVTPLAKMQRVIQR